MFQNILVGIMCVITITAVVWGRWLENGGTFRKRKDNKEDNFFEEEQINEKN